LLETPLIAAMIVLTCTLIGALAGFLLARSLPERHRNPETKDVVRLSAGMVATMAALVLGLVTASAKSTFDLQDTAVKNAAAKILMLDRVLAQYGPETSNIRKAIKQRVEYRLSVTWPQDGSAGSVATSESTPEVENVQNAIVELAPSDESQRWYKAKALDLISDILETRWLAYGSSKETLPLPFLIVVVLWLTMVFLSFGLFAPFNMTVAAATLVSAASIAGAVFIIIELDDPFNGVIRVSPEPLAYVTTILGN
jgi:hypothetical protein